MCGTETQLFKAEVEGAVMKVCSNCGKFGKILSRVKTAEEIKHQKKRQKEQEQRETETQHKAAPI